MTQLVAHKLSDGTYLVEVPQFGNLQFSEQAFKDNFNVTGDEEGTFEVTPVPMSLYLKL